MKKITPLILAFIVCCFWQTNISAQSSPFVNCQQNRSFAIGANGTVTINFSQLSAGSGASAGESVIIRNIFPSVFGCDDLGLQTVALTVQDTSGQNAVCTTTVFITDGQDPVLTCPDDITIDVDPLTPTPINVTYDTPTASDCTVGIDVPGNINQSFTFLGFYTDPDGDVRGYYLSDLPVAASSAFAQSFNVAFMLGSDLATVIDQDHNDWLRESINFVTGATNVEALIGYSDDGLEGSFLWFAGPENRGYENWSTGQPNNQGNEDFTVMLPDGTWNDVGDAVQRRYIMQLEPTATPLVRQTAGLPSGSDFPIGTTTNTFEVTDAFGNTSTCSFDVTVVENPFETEVTLQNGTLSITDIENASNDNIRISNNGTNLIIRDLIFPTVSGGPIRTNATTVTVPLASITNGIVFNAGDGDDRVTFAGSINLPGANNGIRISGLNGIEGLTQSGGILTPVINIGGAFVIEDSSTAVIRLRGLIAPSMSITNVSRLSALEFQTINISGQIDIQTTEDFILIDAFIDDEALLTGVVNIEAPSIDINYSEDLTVGTIVTTNPDETINNLIIADNIELTGPITIAGDAELILGVEGTITQTAGTITANILSIGRFDIGPSTASLPGDNDVNTFGLITQLGDGPWDAIDFKDVDEVALTLINANNVTLEADTFILSQDTELNLVGGDNAFNGNVVVSTTDTANPAVINHQAGTVNFNGNSEIDGAFNYTGANGSITNFNGPVRMDIQTLQPTFGFLNVSEGTFDLDVLINILNEARFNGATTFLKGRGRIAGGPVIIENDAAITLGEASTAVSNMEISDLMISSGIYTPLIVNASDFDIIEALGTVTLNNATLSPIGDYVIQPGEEIIIIDNDGTDAIVGTFNDLPEGSSVTLGTSFATISYVGGDGNDIALSQGPETDVNLSGGILSITDINGGTSDDAITFSNDGTTLTISGLTAPVQVSTGVTRLTETSVSLPIASITNGIAFFGEDGSNSLTINDGLTLSGTTNALSVSGVDTFIQNAALTIGGELSIVGNNTNTIALDTINADSLTIEGFTGITDVGGAIIIGGATNLFASGEIAINDGQGNHEFNGRVNLEANRITFTAGADITFNDVTIKATEPLSNFLIVNPGILTLDGNVDITDQNTNLFLAGNGGIVQQDGIINRGFLILQGNGTPSATLDQPNTINAIAVVNPFVPAESALENLSFTNATNMFIANITVDEFTLTAPQFDLRPDFTIITKNGTAESTFNGDMDINMFNTTGTAIFNHNAGTINFNGTINDFDGDVTYNGAEGTITNINSQQSVFPAISGPNSAFTFGFLNGTGAIDIGDIQVDILNTATFSGSSTLLTGLPLLTGGNTIIENDAVIRPGSGVSGFSYSITDLEMNSGATYSPLVEGTGISDSDTIEVIGTVTLNDANLSPTDGFTIQSSDEVIIINNDGTDAIVGTFNGLPEGSSVTFGDFAGIISYIGGDGNDMVLLADTEDPIAICQDIALTIGVNGLTVTGDQLDGGSTDNSGVVAFLINGQPSVDFTLADVGDTEVTITAVDPSGNSAECTATITLMSNVNVTLPILISEYQPSITNDPQSIEIIGEPGESFVGSFVVIEGDTDTVNVGVVLSADSFSGTFDANGLLTTTIPNITGPTHTVVLTSTFTGTVGVTDIDTDDDGVADDFSAFDTIFDAVGVGDGGICCPLDVLYGTDFGGVDLPSIGNVPVAIFRDGSNGDFFQISNTFGDIFDITGTEINASIFDTTPTADGTFGAINPSSTTFVLINPSVYLQGAALGSSNNLMRDDLRVAGSLPTVSPYGDGLTATFPNGEPNNTIVDWVLVELRDATDPAVIVASQSGLLQRDGDVSNVDGSTLRFDISAGNYFVAIKHRNHLGIMSANAIALSSTPTTVDFSDGSTATFGTNAQTTIGMPTGILGMWSGDVDEDGNVSFTNDGNSILFEVLFNPSNTTNSSLFTGANGYFNGDLELNSNVSFQADLNTLLFNVLFHPENTSGSSLFTFNEQLPESTTTSIQDEDIILNRRAYIEKKLKEIQQQIQKR